MSSYNPRSSAAAPRLVGHAEADGEKVLTRADLLARVLAGEILAGVHPVGTSLPG